MYRLAQVIYSLQELNKFNIKQRIEYRNDLLSAISDIKYELEFLEANYILEESE